MRFKDKVILVTGASRGIGRATAIAFAKEGARVVINYHTNEQAAKEVLEKIGEDNGIIVQADVSKEEDIKRLVTETMKRFGKIDVLVNNAGIALDMPLMEKTVEQWERTLRVNLIGAFLCSKYVGIEMKKQKSGAIVNVSSTNAYEGFTTSVDYDASKAGMNIMTKDFAIEFAPYVRVNAIAIGWADTDLNKSLPPEFIKETSEKIFLKRFGKPEEIASLIVFLASDEASYVNGTIVTIDGGM